MSCQETTFGQSNICINFEHQLQVKNGNSVHILESTSIILYHCHCHIIIFLSTNILDINNQFIVQQSFNINEHYQ